MPNPLTTRQERILRAVVEEFVASGAPVGSKHIVSSTDIDAAASTVRYELARLEDLGYLDHPHTSAGRRPTDRGYRYYVDVVLPSTPDAVPAPPAAIGNALGVGELQREVDAALETLAEVVSQVTNLLGVVTAPPPQGTTVCHVEVLLLQPQVVMVVVITSTGAVNKRLFAFEEPVDPGLIGWARTVFNERVTGQSLGAWSIESRLIDPSMSPREAGFLTTLIPAITDVDHRSAEHLFVGGRARFLSETRDHLAAIDALMERLEERATLLSLLRGALSRHEVYLQIGHELGSPALSGVSMVAANYGVARRNLGTVSLFGPSRMDYGLAIATVREAARRLSELMEGVYQ